MSSHCHTSSAFFIFLTLTAATAATEPPTTAFRRCLSRRLPSRLIVTQQSSSYGSTLLSSIRNLRFTTPATARPFLIVTPTNAYHVQAAVLCGRRHGIRLRIRSGGHDYEGLSYRAVSQRQTFAIVDLAKIRFVDVDAEGSTANVGSGATLGELYYEIARSSPSLGFPSGICPTVSVGGHFAGGGTGMLSRKYGLASDNVIDVIMVDVNGETLSRSSMGEDLFWAVRGGGGSSYGIILAYKIRLVPVPDIVTAFTVSEARSPEAVNLMAKWQQFSTRAPEDLLIRAIVMPQEVQFASLFLGRCSNLLQLMSNGFPELGIRRADCLEMTWIQSVLYFAFYSKDIPLELLLDRGTRPYRYFIGKSDFLQGSLANASWEEVWSWHQEQGAGLTIMDPHGGRISSVPEDASPFPHRGDRLIGLQYFVFWTDNSTVAPAQRMRWIRMLYKRMTRYVSKNPRRAYVNYRDLDLGENVVDGNVSSYDHARGWGEKYFRGNFQRLAMIKGRVDPGDYFRHEQSIPPLLDHFGRSEM